MKWFLNYKHSHGGFFMCDTLVVLPEYTADGSLIFAKNSDRSPNEPHIVVHIPPKDYDIDKEKDVKLTYISIPQVPHTYGVVLMKPSWIWGAEMGFNEFGLNIGNEAVFTTENRNTKDALTGMDMVRLALERTTDAKTALDYMIALLSEFGQGGNCGFDKNFRYHNSFLIADRTKAYVLETAGPYYAAKKVEGYYAISNCLSIESDYSVIHSAAVNNAIRKKHARVDKPFSFNAGYDDKLYTFFAKARVRRASVMKALEDKKGKVTVKDVMNMMRSHAPGKKEDAASVASVCMHGGGIVGDHTTGSYVAKLSKNSDSYYITATSMPCMSLYKPYAPSQSGAPLFNDEKKAQQLWDKAERLHRFFISGQASKAKYIAERDSLEGVYHQKFEEAKTEADRIRISTEAWDAGEKLIDKYLEPLDGKNYTFTKGSRFYRKYWEKKTAELLHNQWGS